MKYSFKPAMICGHIRIDTILASLDRKTCIFFSPKNVGKGIQIKLLV